ncbi:MAG: hypothetical protein PVI78_11580 [Anaerolineales bacterium]|jgi:hypothetical protein
MAVIRSRMSGLLTPEESMRSISLMREGYVRGEGIALMIEGSYLA